MQKTNTTRRMLLGSLAGMLVGAACGGTPAPAGQAMAAASELDGKPPKKVTTVEYSSSGKKKGKTVTEKVVKTDDEWRKQLSPLAYEVTRKKGTEMAFTGKYNKNHAKGIYRCIACGTPLFSSETKFDSGTGWPSFYAPIDRQNVATENDMTYGMVRTEVLCKRCDAHLGHVFPDGPQPTGLRYCINSVSLDFDPAGESEKK